MNDDRGSQSPKSHRILVVDDYPDCAEAVCILLSRLGHVCETVCTGHAAIAALGQFDAEIALVDLGLPDLTGFEVARALRARSPGLYLAAFTGWTSPRFLIEADAAGFDQFVVKPVNAAKLGAVVRRAAEVLRTRPGARTGLEQTCGLPPYV